MAPRYPFIYISSLMRTGSTLMSEAISSWPLAYIFKETHMGKNTFSLTSSERRLLAGYGVDMESFLRYRLPLAFCLRRLRRTGFGQDYMIGCFKKVLHERIIGFEVQLGVKEIRHRGWENFPRHFPGMKVVMTGRDPRDIYLSAHDRHRRDKSLRRLEPFSPESVAAELNEEFQRQLGLRAEADCMCVKYEVLCTRPQTVSDVRSFVGSPLRETGSIGEFLSVSPNRRTEHQIHRGQITTRRVNRWREEPDEHLAAEAQRVFDLMPRYCEFWGYE